MTPPKSPSQPAVSIEQCDREAAAAYARQQAPWQDGMWDRAYKSGEFDTGYLVQMLARHRQTHSTRLAAGGEEVEGDIRIAIWNAGMNGGMGQDLTQAFIRRAMDEPCMKRALSILARDGEVGS